MASSSLRFQTWQWAQTALLAANLAWTTLCLGGFLAETMVVTTCLTAALLAVHGGVILFGGIVAPHERWRIHPASWLCLPFLIYAAANVVWVSPVRWLGWIDWFGWAQMTAVFWVVVNGFRSRKAESAIWATLVILALGCVLLGCYQQFRNPEWLMLHRLQVEQYAGRVSGTFGIPNSMGGFLILLLPVTAALTFRPGATAVARVLFGWVTLVLLFGLGSTVSRGAWLALGCALIIWPLVSGRSWRRRLSYAALVLMALALAGGLAALSSATVRSRFAELVHNAGERSRPILWRAAWRTFESHPLTGSGAGSFDTMFESYRPEGFLRVPLWAHNDYLNTLSDYGALGLLLSVGMAITITVAAIRKASVTRGSISSAGSGSPWQDPLVRRAQAIGLLAFALQLMVDFHLKIPALALAFATIAGLAVRNAWPLEGDVALAAESAARSDWRKTVYAGIALIAATGLAMEFVPRFQAEALRTRARDRIDRLTEEPAESAKFRDTIRTARLELERSVKGASDHAQAWADLSYAWAQEARVDPTQMQKNGAQAEAAADRAVSLAPVVAEFWVRRGVARDMQNRRLEAGDDFIHALQLSPKTPLPWYHYAYHLSLDSMGYDLADAMIGTCLRLDPANREAVRLRQRLATARSGP